MTAYKYELTAYGKTFELSEDNIDNPNIPIAVACHCWMLDCAEADVSPANSVIGDNGVLHVKIPIAPLPPIESVEWDSLTDVSLQIKDIIDNMREATNRAEAGEEDAGEKTIEGGWKDTLTGEPTLSLKRIPLEVPKRAFLLVEGDFWRRVDTDEKRGVVDGGRVREEIADYVADCDTFSIEDAIEELLCADDDVFIDFNSSNSNYSYTKKEVLEAMGDWDACVSDNNDLLADDVSDTILETMDSDCTEEGQTIDTRIGEVQIRLFAVDEDGDPIEEED